MSKLLTNSRGDTIVEVLIAMAVAATVLGSAYTITNRSLANVQQAQEHSEALKIAQSQVEQLRAHAIKSSSADPLFQSGRAFCVATRNGSVTRGQLKEFTSITIVPNATPSNYPAECRDITDLNYRTGFSYDSARSTFTVYVNWPGATGGQDQVSMKYKVYPGE